MTARTDTTLVHLHDGAGELFAEVLRLETKCRILTQSVMHLYAEMERVETDHDAMRRALTALRDENEALCELVAAFVRGEILLPSESEVRH
jgi:hypothetical protein